MNTTGILEEAEREGEAEEIIEIMMVENIPKINDSKT